MTNRQLFLKVNTTAQYVGQIVDELTEVLQAALESFDETAGGA